MSPCLSCFPASLPLPRSLADAPHTPLSHAQGWLHYLLAESRPVAPLPHPQLLRARSSLLSNPRAGLAALPVGGAQLPAPAVPYRAAAARLLPLGRRRAAGGGRRTGQGGGGAAGHGGGARGRRRRWRGGGGRRGVRPGGGCRAGDATGYWLRFRCPKAYACALLPYSSV